MSGPAQSKSAQPEPAPLEPAPSEPAPSGPAPSEPAPSEPLRRDVAAALTVILLVVGAVVVQRLVHELSPKPSRDQCEQLLAHYLDRASRQHHPGVEDRAVAEAIAAASADPELGPDLLTCEHDLTAAQVECGLAASNVDQVERCLQ